MTLFQPRLLGKDQIDVVGTDGVFFRKGYRCFASGVFSSDRPNLRPSKFYTASLRRVSFPAVMACGYAIGHIVELRPLSKMLRIAAKRRCALTAVQYQGAARPLACVSGKSKFVSELVSNAVRFLEPPLKYDVPISAATSCSSPRPAGLWPTAFIDRAPEFLGVHRANIAYV